MVETVNYNEKTVDWLRKHAKEIGIKNVSKYRKAELIDKIIESEKTLSSTNSINIDYESKKRYVDNIEIGTLVAFKLQSGKVKSAKVTRKSTKVRKLKLITDYGAEFIVSYDDVIWVRTGKRWPRGVYNLLKGITSNGQS